MERKRYLLINKKEWDRLKRQTGPPETPDNQKEYLQALTEKSREWLKSWPDSVQGMEVKAAKKKEKQRLREISYVKFHADKKKKDKQKTVDAMQRARQLIFEGTSYGKQLISAILASKTLEEREIQVRFQKEIKHKEIESEKALEAQQSYFFGSETVEKLQQKKQYNKEIAEINKCMYKENKRKISQKKETEIKLELEDTRLMKQLLENEATEKDHCKVIEKQAVEEFVAEQKKIQEREVKNEKRQEELAEVWYKYQDRIRCKEKRVFLKIHKDKHDTAMFKSNYDNLQNILEKEKKSYEEFIKKGIKKLNERVTNEENKNFGKQKQRHEKHISQSQENKSTAEIEQIMRCKNNNKCFCERQSLFTKSCKDSGRKTAIELPEEDRHLSFLTPANKLLEELKKREKKSSEWSGLKGAHEQFAKQASEALAECQHKHVARKVVDNYRKFNGLDSTTLPVSNY